MGKRVVKKEAELSQAESSRTSTTPTTMHPLFNNLIFPTLLRTRFINIISTVKNKL